MNGLMMNTPLLVSSLIEHASRYHADTEIVSRRIEGDIHRYTYRDCLNRSKQLANALVHLGVQTGERIGTLAWNGYRHLELYYAVSGMGNVLHTINPRLFPHQIAYIINHADDQFIFFDATFVELVRTLQPLCPRVKGWYLLGDEEALTNANIGGVSSYETLLEAQCSNFIWPKLDENTASSMCYSSGTTGNPKGVLYSNRSVVLHSYAVCLPDTLSISARDVVLPVVPMFHANAWGLPYACPLAGAKLVLPGKELDGKSLVELFIQEGVTISGGVPTVWLGVLDYLKQTGQTLPTLKRTMIGGSSCPPAMIKEMNEVYGIEVRHTWGMTEMSPVGSTCTLKGKHQSLSTEEKYAILSKQGRAIFGVDMKIVNGAGEDLPWDGQAFGDLWVRGPWVCASYYQPEGGNPHTADGWFPTGDVAKIDADGYVSLTDRSKDVIKSGGEWISSIDLENIAMAHPAVHEAATIGIPHPKWDERPLLVVVTKPNQVVSKAELLTLYDGKVAKWWIPDDVVFVDELPHTATGKIQKLKIREQFVDFKWPNLS